MKFIAAILIVAFLFGSFVRADASDGENAPPEEPPAKIVFDISDCDVCQIIAEEVFRQILMTNAHHMEQVGFRMDNEKRVPFARTEYRLLQIIEGLCDMDLFLSPHHPIDEISFPPPRTGADKKDIEEIPKYHALKRKCYKFIDSYAFVVSLYSCRHHEHIIASFNKNEKPYKVKLCVERLEICEAPITARSFGSQVHEEL